MTVTIVTPEQVAHVVAQLGRLYQSLAALRRQVEPANPRNFAVLAEGHLDEIRALREQLDEYAGVVAADQQGADLWLRVVGRDIDWQSAPTSVLTAILDVLRKGVVTVAEFVLTGGLTTRPTAALKKAGDFRIQALAPGSLRIGVGLPEGDGDAARATREALDDYLAVAAWAASDAGDEAIATRVPDARRRTVILNELARLVPREKGLVDQIELSGRLLRAAPVTLARPTRTRIDAAIDRASSERVETHVGDLREIDLDECAFILRNPEPPGAALRCYFPEEMAEAAKDALDKRVRVTGSRAVKAGRQTLPLTVHRLEILEER